jgi:uncharacterized phage protein gp47/JayE
MSYSPPTIGASGLTIPTYADILAWLIGQYQGIYGNAAYLGTDAADYQDIAVRALQASDFGQSLQALYLAFNPQTAIGASLDLIGKLIGTARKAASQSIALVTLTGTPGAVVTRGMARDVNGNYWDIASPATIGSSGTVAIIATAQNAGNITANPGDISSISTPTAGWTAVTNPAAAMPGQAVEPDSRYRARLMVAQTKPSVSLVAGTAAAIAAVSGVTRSQVYENPTGDVDSYGNPAHSITCVTEGGSTADIAQAIYSNRGIGCETNGATTVNVIDTNNNSISMPISFDVLDYVPVYVSLSVHGLTGFTSAAQAAIASAIVNYLNSLGIGEGVVFSELYGAALTARPDPDQPLFSIRAMLSGSQAASTAGSTTSGSPTVTVASASGIAADQVVVGPGVPSGTTVSTVVGTTVTLSANATASGTGVALEFFTTGTTDIAVAFNKAAQGSAAYVVVNLV